MAKLQERLAGLSPDKRQLVERMLGSKPASPRSALPLLSSQKAECRRFYDEVSQTLDASEAGSFSLFLNLGYSGERCHSVIELPEYHLNKNSMRLVLEMIGHCDLTGRRILDVGCGRGGAVSVVKQFFCPKSIHAVDLAPAAVRFCRMNHPDVIFEIGDAECLPFEDEVFDVILNIESSSTYPDISAFYRQVWRVLVPGGQFLYTDALPSVRFTECTAYLRRLGFRLQLDREITSNVLASCDQISIHRMQAYGSGHSAGKEDFLATPGSSIYESMKSGEWTYRIQRWSKPGMLFG